MPAQGLCIGKVAASPGRDANPGLHCWAPTQEPCTLFETMLEILVLPPAQGGIQILSKRVTDPVETLGHASRDLKIAECRQPRAGYKSWAHFEGLDVTVAKSIEIRRKPHPELVPLTTSIAGASELPELAADRLNKVRKLHEATPHGRDHEEQLSSTETRVGSPRRKRSRSLTASVTKATEIRRKLYLEFVALTAGPVYSFKPDSATTRRDQVCLGVGASMEVKASARLDVYAQGKQGSDC